MRRKGQKSFFHPARSLMIVASWSYFCISVTAAPSFFRAGTCDVEIAGYCCRNDTLSKPVGFELSCFSKDREKDGTLTDLNFRNTKDPHEGAALPRSDGISSGTRSPAFKITFRSGSMLTIQCTTATPNVPSLLTYLKVQNVTNAMYINCCVPQGNLSFSRIFDGNLGPLISMTLETPLRIPNGTLQGKLFDGLSTSLRDLVINQNIENESFDLSDDFFKIFKSLRFLHLTASMARIPPSLKSLSELTHLYLSSTEISEITSDASSNLTSLDNLHIFNAPIAEVGYKPFSDLGKLTKLTMSGFHITDIPHDILYGLNHLEALEFSGWAKLSTLQTGIFGNTPALSHLKLDTLPLLERLPARLFEELTKVTRFEIIDCGLTHLQTNLWPGRGRASDNLNFIAIVNNKIETLPKYFFRDNTRLLELNLEQNRLRKIGKSLQEISSLRWLNLYGNRLVSISESDFEGLEELQHLNLSDNRIEFIEHGSFEKLHDLQSLILSNNKLQSFDNLITADNEVIAHIYLSNNKITSFPDIPFDDLYFFDTLQMDDNLISTFEVPVFESDDTAVHLKRNRIELILFSKFDGRETMKQGEHLFYIDGNPFQCNGENFNFLRYARGHMLSDIAMFENLDNCYCNGTSQLVRTVDLRDLFTEVENCPEPCTCLFFPFNASTVVGCDYKNLSSIPVLPSGVTELNFEGNALETFPESLSTYGSLQMVNLKKNLLWSVDEMFSLVPTSLRSLSVESNQLERLNIDPSNELKFSVALSDNPWICDCDAKNFKSFLDENAAKILDYSAIKCKDSLEVDGLYEFSLSRIPLDVMCPTLRPIVRIVVTSVITVFGLTLLVVILYFKNRSLVTAFIYVHFNALFQLMSRESDPDEVRKYDAFISYASTDREIAIQVLNKLESIDADSPKHFEVPFRLCFHERDFVAGQSITWNIHNAVKSSHRTIFILSQEFLESPWSTLEFETAYNQMLDDHTSRLIIIIKSDSSKFENLNENVRAVLSTRTYLVWGERWFWKKLFYAMPHTNRTQGKTERF